MTRTYEAAQLRMIAAEYEAEGYSVSLEEVFRLGDRSFRADAVARRGPSELILVELVNAVGKIGDLDKRATDFGELVREMPALRVDLRYIDNPIENAERRLKGASRSMLDGGPRLADLLKRPLPRRKSTHAAADYLWHWSILGQILRGASPFFQIVGTQFQDITLEEIWRRIQEHPKLKKLVVSAPAFIGMQDRAEIALEGGDLSVHEVEELRKFLLLVRREFKLARFVRS